MTDKLLLKTAETAVSLLKENGLTIATAESCTGGLVAATVTEFSGVSSVFEMGIVSYSCQVKNKLLGVKSETLEIKGAVSEDTAIQMAEGIRQKSGATFGLSVTGVAGPDSSEGHPVGYVFIAVASPENTVCKLLNIKPKSRSFVRKTAAIELFQLLIQEIRKYINV